MRHQGRWIIACTGVLLAGLGHDLLVDRDSRVASLAREAVTPTPRVRAMIVLQRADCESNLRILELLHRRAVRDAIALEAILNVGAAGDSVAMRALLPAWTRGVPINRATPAEVRQLAELGHRSSPMLVLLDLEGRVRLVSQSPRSSREFAGLRRAIEGLTWFHDL